MLVLQPHGQGSILSRRSAWFRRSSLSESSSRPGSFVKFVGVNSTSSLGQAASGGCSGAGLTFGRSGFSAQTSAASTPSSQKDKSPPRAVSSAGSTSLAHSGSFPLTAF